MSAEEVGRIVTKKIRASQFPIIRDHEGLRKKYLTLARRSGYGMRVKYPRHPKTFAVLSDNFPNAESIIDFGTDAAGECMRSLALRARGTNKKPVGPFKIIHGTCWHYEEFSGNFARLEKQFGDTIDIKCFPYSYQELHHLPDKSYDVALSINVLDHLPTWDEAREARDQILRIVRKGAIFVTDTHAKEKIAWTINMRCLQSIGLNRDEWNQFFREVHGKQVWSTEGFYVVRLRKQTARRGRKRSVDHAQVSRSTTESLHRDVGEKTWTAEPLASSFSEEDLKGSNGKT